MKVGDRVALAAAHDWTGRVTRVREGLVDMEFDTGGKAKGLPEEDLVAEETGRERDRASDDKSWPPSTMETKVPGAAGRK